MITSRRVVATAAALALVPLTVAAGSASASTAASTSAVACSITPRSATVYTKAVGVTFDAPGASTWTIEVSDLFIFAYDLGESGSATAESMNPFSYTDAGAHDAVVIRDDSPDCITPFTLKRGASISLAASHKSPYRVLSGKLTRVNFGFTGDSQKVAGAKIALQRKTASGGWVTVKTVTTNASGAFSAKIKIAKHTWRAVYAGNVSTGTRTSTSKAA